MDAERKKPDTLSGVAPEATPSPAVSTSTLISRASSADQADPELSWKTLLGIEPAAARPSQEPAGRRTEMRSVPPEPRASAGYYSSRPAPEYAEAIVSLRPARLSHQESSHGSRDRAASESSKMTTETNRIGDAQSTTPDARATAPEAPISRPAESSRVPAITPVPLAFPTHIRQQADGWLQTGSLSLPNSSSPRHARAIQRALLLALLANPGYEALPLGLQQRVGWLLSPGWESAQSGASYGELSDLLTVLALPSDPLARQRVLLTCRSLIPDPLPSVRPPSSYPPARR